MKSINIQDLDPDIMKAINELAKAEGISITKAVKKLLRNALKLSKKEKPKRNVDEIFGIWSEEEAKEFGDSIKSFDKIDEDLWQ